MEKEQSSIQIVMSLLSLVKDYVVKSHDLIKPQVVVVKIPFYNRHLIIHYFTNIIDIILTK